MVHLFNRLTWQVVASYEQRRKGENADDAKQIADGTKQNKRSQEVYAVPRGSQFCKSGLGILRKGEVIP
ncbi:hypothetical protein T4D_15655 [Trichinella pseudospiralis]|uniref:Uncharacterized protein n=1 Tax=Trichinella pseudospiralis TaxID=6337 RepID=A0A0V1F577_TRIPS|nr:hypothetical protein T4D_15655 [Trichinella pseudospiralis]